MQPLFPFSVFKNKNMASDWQLMEGNRSLRKGKSIHWHKLWSLPLKNTMKLWFINNIWHRWLVPWGVNGNEVLIIILLVVLSSFYTSKQSKLNSIWKQNYNEKHRDFDFEFISNKVPICLCTVSFKILDNLNIKILGKY